MRKFLLCLACLIVGLALPAWALEAEQADPQTSPLKAHGVKSLEERVEQLEQTISRTPESGKWYDRIEVGGLVEVEAAHQKIDYKDPAQADEKSDDVDLATVELGFDAKIAPHVDGHILLKYEDDDVFIDEGFVLLSGGEALPAYLKAGRQYIPFGNFDSHFVTDPNTLILGETNEGAAVAGWQVGGEMLEIAAGVFNGRAREAGDDDTLDSFVAGVVAHPFEALQFGLSYTSNLAGSNGFEDNDVLVDPENLDALVGGWSAFVTFEFMERFKLIAEYVSALDSFKPGELYDDQETRSREPSAWNFELGAKLLESLEVAVRYGGSDDGGPAFLPESQYGVVVNWGFFENTNLALEYLHDEFEDDEQEIDTVTAQLAIAF